MGGGCVKHDVGAGMQGRLGPLGGALPSSAEAARARLEPVIRAAVHAGGLSPPRLDEAVEVLSSVRPSDGCLVFGDWLDRATASSRAGMVLLMQQVIARILDANVVVAEELAGVCGESAEILDFSILAERCREALRLDEAHQCAVFVAAFTANRTAMATKEALDENPTAYIVPAFDRIVLLFRHAFLAQLGSSARNLRQWSEFMEETGLPRLEEHLALLSWSAKATLASMLLIPEDMTPATIVLRRESALADAGTQLPDAHACVVSPYFESSAGTKVIQSRRVEGGEGHGPRKEFFTATSNDALKRWGTPAVVMFEFHRGTGQQWFSAYASELGRSGQGGELRRRFRSFGKLLALAVANRCKISFTLPLIFFELLLHRAHVPVLMDLKGFDNALHASLNKCLAMRPSQFNQVKEAEGLPDATSKEDYVASRVRTHLVPDGMTEVRQGFWALVGGVPICGVSASDLRHMVCPTETHLNDMDIRQIFIVVMEDEMAECAPLVDAFWSVIDGLSLKEKQQFLLFVTGVDTPPERGAERLIIQLPFCAFTKEEQIAMLQKLPQAHTCTNTLELPNYYESLQAASGFPGKGGNTRMLAGELRRVLGEKLRMAINESAGYELDAVDADGGGGALSPVEFRHSPEGHPPHPVAEPAKVRGPTSQLHANIEGLLQEYESLVPHHRTHSQEYEPLVPHHRTHSQDDLAHSGPSDSAARPSGVVAHETPPYEAPYKHDLDSLLEELQLLG